jgi:hypothetical protein
MFTLADPAMPISLFEGTPTNPSLFFTTFSQLLKRKK